MSEPTSPPPSPNADEAARLSALFAGLVLQLSELASRLLGGGPAEEGQPKVDLEHARMLIDQLEMLEIKTRGNLSKAEESLLQRSLMTLRLAYVEAVDRPSSGAAEAPKAEPTPAVPAAESAAADESRKRFTKKY